jgi:hypothetical protein
MELMVFVCLQCARMHRMIFQVPQNKIGSEWIYYYNKGI